MPGVHPRMVDEALQEIKEVQAIERHAEETTNHKSNCPSCGQDSCECDD